ncbi:hypothetical protein GCM10017056_49350 [Seohaeicola zhoushanensis]|uniref:DUF2147 domain-containing protein n=2 Tax=Seohaeicola zhoushanensis TaxID=1569283 RepID=A0A8J3MCA5_9RHOB|nr:hypothetical protein GCM10017056_49350 [Seohaeicola zhoushanensis]
MIQMFPLLSLALAAVALVAAPTARAASPEGVWLTQPDRKGGYAHIRAHACGPALCGTVEKAFDRTGAEIWTPNVGKRVFWDMWEDEQGHYRGRAWVPMLKREYPGSIRLLGDRLQVHGCSGPICMSQTWTRVK